MSGTVNCANCNAVVDPTHRFCGACGAPLPSQQRLDTPGGHAGTRQTTARLVRIQGLGDGASYDVGAQPAVAGRVTGDIRFADDPFISPRHAEFCIRDDRLFVQDLNSENGVFIRLREPTVLQDGDYFMAGEQLFKILTSPPEDESGDTDYFGSMRPTEWARMQQILEDGDHGLCRFLGQGTVSLGREGMELDFPNDRFISGRHCGLELKDGQVVLTDLSSRNGTYVRRFGETELTDGDFVFLGRQLLRVDLASAVGGAS